MNKLYDDYFKIDDDKPIREKVFLARIAVSICFIIVCLFAMGFAAYGFFAAELSSSSNLITSAYYTLDVDVSKNTENNTRSTDEVVNVSAGIYHLSAPGEYTLTLSKPIGDSNIASTGFATISVYGTDSSSTESITVYTKPIGKMLKRDENGDPVLDIDGEYTFDTKDSRSFTVVVNEEAYLSVVPSWGNYSGTPFDESKEKITFGRVANTVTVTEDDSTEQSQPETENVTGSENETEAKPETETETETEIGTETETETGIGTGTETETEAQPSADSLSISSEEEEQATE